MGKRDDSKQISLQRLIDTCDNAPDDVTFSRRAAKEAYEHFGFEMEADIKNFIAQNGFDVISYNDCCESDEIPGTYISSFIFKIERTPGYLAFHQKVTDVSKLHVKSFHKNELSPDQPIGSLAELFPKNILGGQDE